MSDWKYDVDEVGEDADSGSADSGTGDADSTGPEQDALERDPSAPESGPGERSPHERDRGPLEPGSPTVENAFFVTLGVATMLFLFARVVLVVG